ncbi:MAG: HD domain-containing protein [Dehalococcoidia bacterium]|nr:MAG: HD domain-containing protein [Dehalococcoidia bacterium]
MPDMIEARTPYVPGATAPVLPPAREVRVRPARRLDLIACLADGFDLAEQEAPGHAARVASLARDIAARLGLNAEVQRSALEAGLLHDAGVSVPIAGDRAAGGAWVAQRFGLNVAVQDAVRASRERWDGGGPLALAGAGIPRASLCVRAAHWVCETAEHAGNPLRARAEIARTPVEALVSALGPEVAAAARDVVRDDAVWLAVWDDSLAARLALSSAAGEQPSHRQVVRAAEAMGAVVDAAVREPGRATRVASLARALGAVMGLHEGYTEALGVAGHLLDAGQLGVPRNIAGKPSILTVDEMEHMRRHPGLGARMIERIPGMGEIASWVEWHHERPDGRGYPEMLMGDSLPLAPRILGAADAYCALRAQRPYRQTFSPDEALRLMEAGRGAQFDPLVVDALPAALASAAEAEPAAWAGV